MKNLKQTLQNIAFFDSEPINTLRKKNSQVIDYITDDLIATAKRNSKNKDESSKIISRTYSFQTNEDQYWMWLNSEDVIRMPDPDFIVEYFTQLDLDVKMVKDNVGLTLTLSWN